MRRRWLPLVLVLVTVTVAAGAVAGRNVVRSRLHLRDLTRLAPGLDGDLARRVVSDSDQEWLAYCRRVGLGRLGDAYQTLGFELRRTGYVEFLERRAPLERASLRIAQGFTKAFGFAVPEQSLRYYMSIPAERDFHLRQLERRYIEVEADTSLSADVRIRIVDDMIREFFEHGDPSHAILAYLVATRIELEAGRPDQHRDRLETAVRMARQYGQVYAECQVLGELGAIHGGRGDEDSLRICLDEGIAVALRHGLLDQAARMLKFYAAHHADQGRLALALDHLAEAQRLCERPGGDSARLRLQIEYTKFLADLGCWDLVDRSLRRLPPLLREFPQIGRESEARKHAFDADRLRARLAFATGDPARGSRLMRALSQSVPAVHRRVGYAELLDEWSAGLEMSGRPTEALEICGQGLSHCDSAHVPERQVLLQLRRARSLIVLGRTLEARDELARVESRRPARSERDEAIHREIRVLQARVHLRQGREAEARRQIRDVLHEFQRGLDEGDGGPLNYLELDAAVSLRDAVHEIAGSGPEEGYAFEMDWRGFPRDAARHRRGSACETRRERAERSHRAIDGTHVVYRCTRDRLLRWTATADGVALDTIPMPALQCLERVREALGLLQTESPGPGALLGPKALRSLRPLSEALLPRSVLRGADRTERLYVSADGPLLALPFEALPVPTTRGERPLALGTDVAYIRGWDGRDARSGAGRAVVVTNPSLSPELLRRHGWAPGLRGPLAEPEAALTRWPGALVLSGDHATREAVMRSWPGASIIYLATHHVRDADAPVLGFVPLATPVGTSSNDAFLEVADVHSMDLSSCRLAVLASCASGAPYRMALRPGVSLGDAVLDAGADAVVQSFWDVGDLETREFMRVFLAMWREDGSDTRALNQARRRIMSSPSGAAPRVWAAWSLLEALPERLATADRIADRSIGRP